MSRITVGGRNYNVPVPSKPIPQGKEDCFARYRDMDVPICQNCEVNEYCGAVMDIIIKEQDLRRKRK
jgi:hypothetical protein